MKYLEDIEGQISTLVEQSKSVKVKNAFNLHQDQTEIGKLCKDIEFLMHNHYQKKLIKDERLLDEECPPDL